MRRQTLLAAAGAALAVLVLWYVVLWSPRKADLSEARESRQTAEAARDELATRVARLRASQKDEPLKRARVEAMRTSIPDEPNLGAFILDTNEAAAKAGIDFISIAPTEPAPAAATAVATIASAPAAGSAPVAGAGAQPAEIKLQLQITGGYFQVLDFLNRMNDLPRLVVTDGLTVSSDDKAKLTVGMTARMFVRTVPPGFGDVPAAPLATPVAPPAPAAAAPPPAVTAAATATQGPTS